MQIYQPEDVTLIKPLILLFRAFNEIYSSQKRKIANQIVKVKGLTDTVLGVVKI